MKEEWRPVIGWDNYKVSSLGRVILLVDGKKTMAGILSPNIRPGKYVTVNLSDGVQKNVQKRMQYLVLEAFVGPRPKGLVARHLDDDKTNNKLSNLSWGTYKDNSADAKRNGILVGHASHSKSVREAAFKKGVETRRKNGNLGYTAFSPKARLSASKNISKAMKKRSQDRVARGLTPGQNTMSSEVRKLASKKIADALKKGHASGKYDGIKFGRAAFTKEERHLAALQTWKTRKEKYGPTGRPE